jgi:hypothetical protein
MVKSFSYSYQSLFGSYVRAILGLILTLVPLLLLNPTSVIVYLLIFLFIVFFCYGIRTVFRHFSRIELSDTGICVRQPFKWYAEKTIRWEELGGFKLSYYSTRRDREAGWMHLKIKSKGFRLSIDSTISDFEELVRQLYSGALKNGLSIDPSTRRNLQALGIAHFQNEPTAERGYLG